MGVSIRHRGSFKKTEKFFGKAKHLDYKQLLNVFGEAGVEALASATPFESGETAVSWTYEIVEKGDTVSIFWSNTNVNDGVNIAVILQYGHGTRNGGYVQGRDYINPALQPIFDKLADEAWKKIKNL